MKQSKITSDRFGNVILSFFVALQHVLRILPRKYIMGLQVLFFGFQIQRKEELAIVEFVLGLFFSRSWPIFIRFSKCGLSGMKPTFLSLITHNVQKQLCCDQRRQLLTTSCRMMLHTKSDMRCSTNCFIFLFWLVLKHAPLVASRTYSCFPFNGTSLLRRAVVEYVNTVTTPGKSKSRRRYGPVIGNWCVGKVRSFDGVFAGLQDFNEPLLSWNTTSASNMRRMFQGCRSFNQDLSHFDVSNVKTMERMFFRASRFRGMGLSKWDVSRLENLVQTFRYATMFKQNLCHWGTMLSTSTRILSSAAFSGSFASTNCPTKENTKISASPPGPFCFPCFFLPTARPSRPPLRTKSGAPVTISLTRIPTLSPSTAPSQVPYHLPSSWPSGHPSKAPTLKPTPAHTSAAPTSAPTSPVPTPVARFGIQCFPANGNELRAASSVSISVLTRFSISGTISLTCHQRCISVEC